MPITGRIMLIDLENVIGTNRKPAVLRSLVAALLDAAGPHHHTVAAYASHSPDSDSVAPVLIALGVVPLPVEPGPNAAENALIAHAIRVHRQGCSRFTVSSGDRAFAKLAHATKARLDILAWKDNRSRPGCPRSPRRSGESPFRSKLRRQVPGYPGWP